jgi:hypothetical protein
VAAAAAKPALIKPALAKAVHLGGLLWQAVLLGLAVPGRRPVQEVRGVMLVQEVSLGSPSKGALRRIRRMGSQSSGELTSSPMYYLAQHQTRATMGETREKTSRRRMAEMRGFRKLKSTLELPTKI